jgi:hypothetical protein
MPRTKLTEEQRLESQRITKEKNRIRALQYYHENKEVRPKVVYADLNDYLERKKKYYQEYYQRRKQEI